MSPDRSILDAVIASDLVTLQRLLREHKDVNAASQQPGEFHRTALHFCVWDNFIEGAKLLLPAGANVNALDDLHDTPFLLAGAEGRSEILQLIYANAERVLKIPGLSARRVSAAVPDYKVVNRFGGSALIPACERGHVAVVKLLIEKGIDVNHYNHHHWTGLLEVVELGGDDREHVEIVRLLIKGGVDVNQTDAHGHTPLQLARKYRFTRIAALLEAAGGHE